MTEIERIRVLSIDDYVKIVRDVWAINHDRRTTIDYAMHVLDHASKLGEAIRLDNLDDIFTHLAEVSNWLFGFVAKLNDHKESDEKIYNIKTKFSAMIWNKYPNFCPVCFKRDLNYLFKRKKQIYKKDVKQTVKKVKGKCLCLNYYPDIEHRSDEERKIFRDSLLRYAAEWKLSKPNTLWETEEMFHKIYKSNTAVQTLESIGFHLLEEVGEIVRAIIDLYTKHPRDKNWKEKAQDLCDEIADTFSWICTLTAKLNQLFESHDLYLKNFVEKSIPLLKSFGDFGEMIPSYKLAHTVRLEWAIIRRYVDPGTKKYKCPYCEKFVCKCKLKFAWEQFR